MIWLLIKFWSDIKDFALDMKEGFIREFALSAANILPYLLLYGLGYVANSMTEDFMFFAGTLLLTNALGIVFRANHMRLRRQTLQERGYVNVLR